MRATLLAFPQIRIGQVASCAPAAILSRNTDRFFLLTEVIDKKRAARRLVKHPLVWWFGFFPERRAPLAGRVWLWRDHFGREAALVFRKSNASVLSSSPKCAWPVRAKFGDTNGSGKRLLARSVSSYRENSQKFLFPFHPTSPAFAQLGDKRMAKF